MRAVNFKFMVLNNEPRGRRVPTPGMIDPSRVDSVCLKRSLPPGTPPVSLSGMASDLALAGFTYDPLNDANGGPGNLMDDNRELFEKALDGHTLRAGRLG